MIIIGDKEKRKDGAGGDSYEELEKFSKEIIGLGQRIENKLEKKGELEGMIRAKEQEFNSLRKEIFSLKNQLSKVKSELMELEKQRKEALEEREEL